MTNYYSDNEAREMICEVGRRVYARNFVAANDGNISVKVSPNAIWATPTGVSKGYMTPDMLVKLDLDGNVLEGTHKCSSEVKMHLRAYNENPDINAVVHVHPPIATSFAVAGIPLDKPILPEAIVMLGSVPVAEYAMPSTEGVAESIAPYCKNHNAVLLANHGAITWGADLMQAYHRMESLEHYAAITMYTTNIIKGYNELSCNQVHDLLELRAKLGIKTGGTPNCKITTNDDQVLESIILKVIEKIKEER